MSTVKHHDQRARITTEEDPSPLVIIHIDLEAEHPVQADPTHLHLNTGLTAVWYIEGIPESHSIRFDFEGFTDHLGPFSALLASPITNGTQVHVGLNFSGATEDHPDFPYLIVVLDENRSSVAHGDPVIDPLGPPPGPPGP